MGFKLFAPKASEAAAATAIMAPEGTDSGVIVKGLRAKFAAIVTDGQGEMKGSLFRIAHLGFFDYMDTIAMSPRTSRHRSQTPPAQPRLRHRPHRRPESLRRTNEVTFGFLTTLSMMHENCR
jgi:hypothetical protein